MNVHELGDILLRTAVSKLPKLGKKPDKAVISESTREILEARKEAIARGQACLFEEPF